MVFKLGTKTSRYGPNEVGYQDVLQVS